MTRLNALILFFAAVCVSACQRAPLNEPQAAAKRQIALVIVPDSSLRIDPLVSSARVMVLGTGENAEVIDHSREKSAVGGKQDYWYKIRLRSGITGWVWGQNVKIFAEGESASVESYARELRREEEEKIRKELKGKWWSFTGEDTFTNHILVIKSDGTFASLLKGGDKPIEGNYTLDTEKARLTFDVPTAFGESVDYIIRGDIFMLEASGEKRKMKFKRISSDPSFKDELPAESPAPGAAGSAAAKSPEAKQAQ